METYTELKRRQQAEFEAFPLYFAFGEKQYKELLEKLNLTEEEAEEQLIPIGCGGGVVLKKDKDRFCKMVERLADEEDAAIAADKTGDGFIFQMFLEELRNHEYSYTGDIEETIDACQLTVEEINASPALLHGLQKAIDYIKDHERSRKERE